MFVWCANSSAQIMQNSRPQQGATNTLSLDSAKNMTVCGQVCLREHKDFKIEKAEFSAEFPVRRNSDFFAKIKNKLSE